jgi:ornithine carbamoyltransferase
VFLHCLPIRRNVIATDGVLDSKRSLVVDQAEQRLWTAAAAIARLVGRA